MKRDGFSLIELVLAIVIIAISLMSIPTLLSQSIKSNEFALIQESVMAARTKMGNILSFQWDQNSTSYDENDEDTINGVLIMDVKSGDDELNRTIGTSFRKGHIRDVNRRRFYKNQFLANQIGHDLGTGDDFDDIDDFDGESISVMLTDGAGSGGSFDYLGGEELNITTKVRFLNDNSNYSSKHLVFNFGKGAGKKEDESTNIKMVELNISSSYSKTPFILRAYSCNIGGIDKLYEEDK